MLGHCSCNLSATFIEICDEIRANSVLEREQNKQNEARQIFPLKE
jgi:hypothetical protein